MALRKHGTLVASTVATVTVAGAGQEVEIINRGGTDIFATIDGTTVPTVAGDDTYAVPAGGFLRLRAFDQDRDADVDIKLISSGTPDYSVELL